MIVGEGTATVNATPDEVFDFVFDLKRYRLADHKIGKVGKAHIEPDGKSGTVQFSGKIRGLPGPSGVYPFTRGDRTLRFGSPIGGLAKLFLDFEGTFECTPTDDGTVVVHRETFMFKKPWKWLAEPLLRGWLERDTIDEMRRVKELLEPPA
jgi:hypothetical protein